MTLDEAADRLYALPPEEFTAARDELVRQARAAGDAPLAAAIGALRRPTVVAWLANRLAREHPDEVRALVELGQQLRQAMASLQGEELRALSRQQHQVVVALVGQARESAEAAGRQVSMAAQRELEDTIQAALADPAAAEQLVRARLTEALTPPTSFPTDLEAAPAARPVVTRADANRPTGAADHGAQQRAHERARAKAEADVARLQAQHEKAAAQLAEVQEAAQATYLAAAEAQRDVEELTQRLDAARRAVAKAEHDEKSALIRVEKAEQRATVAEQAWQAAQRRLAALTDDD